MLRVIIASMLITSCYCFATYEIFSGFSGGASNTTTTNKYKLPNIETEGTTTSSPVSTTFLQSSSITSTTSTTNPVQPVTSGRFQCPEDEQPSNIGAYEVPTQRDIVLLVRKSLTKMFNAYHQKALYFLKDIKEATKSTQVTEKNCRGYDNRISYRRCVRQVNLKSELITKGLVTSLEKQRRDVQAFTNGTICNVKNMKADPIELIKTLAMEVASFDFALPGFLRLLSACSVYCAKAVVLQTRMEKPLRHMTDQDLVVKHFLTKKSYIQLLKGSK